MYHALKLQPNPPEKDLNEKTGISLKAEYKASLCGLFKACFWGTIGKFMALYALDPALNLHKYTIMECRIKPVTSPVSLSLDLCCTFEWTIKHCSSGSGAVHHSMLRMHLSNSRTF